MQFTARRTLVVVPALAVCLGICLGVTAAPLAARSSQGLNTNDTAKIKGMLKDAHEAIRKNYYDQALRGLDWDGRYQEYLDKIPSASSLGAGISLVAGFVDGLHDSHTYFQPPSWSKHVDYGYDIGIVGDQPYVLRTRPETDAASKLHAGDRIVTINGNGVTRESFTRMRYILNLLSPQVMTSVAVEGVDGTLREERVESKVTDGQALTMIGPGSGTQFSDLIRDMENAQYELRSRAVDMGDVLIWRLPTFLVEPGDLEGTLAKARKARTVILDLRNNPGGYIDTLRRLVGSVFTEDQVIGTRVTRRGRGKLSASSRGDKAFTGRLIVLIDSASGSSAELFARVVQLEKRGEVLGDRSAGAVMEARYFPFVQGTNVLVPYGVSVTSADILMKDGMSLEGVGVTPDTILLPTAADLAAGRDPVLSQAAALAGVTLDPVAAAALFREKE